MTADMKLWLVMSFFAGLALLLAFYPWEGDS